jgi:uncharacterized protein YbjT (DUF2867 family)
MVDDKGNVLVVGAQTADGRAYATGLALAGYRVWAPVRPLEDAGYLRAIGVRPVTVNTLDPYAFANAVSETAAVVIALDGGTAGMGGTEDFLTSRFIEAAQSQQVQHLVFSSALHADRTSFIAHLRTRAFLEDLVVQSGLPYTVLRPAPLMEALVEGPLSYDVRQTGVVQSPIKGDVPVSYLAARDLGRFAVLALEDAALNCETVEVGGPEPVTFNGLLPWVAGVFRRPVTYEEIPLRKLKRRLGEHGVQLIAQVNREGCRVDMRPLLERVHLPLADVRTFLSEAWQRAEARAAKEARGRSAAGGARSETA